MRKVQYGRQHSATHKWPALDEAGISRSLILNLLRQVRLRRCPVVLPRLTWIGHGTWIRARADIITLECFQS
jgi:hypothetical protein